MAYDRAPRVFLAVTDQTGPNVAPNSYQTAYDEQCACKGSNWAPFLVCSGRKTQPTFATPAPNAYYPKLNKTIPGGASMRYTEKRFRRQESDTPGPLIYDPYHTSESFKKNPPPRLKGYIYHCNTPYTIQGYCPSIPRNWHKGYDKLSDGTLVECCFPDNDATLGPAYYKVNYDTFGSCYRGPYWSKYSRRKTSSQSDIPGVGTYDIEPKPNETYEYLLKLRNERMKHANVPRYMDKVQCDAVRNNFPAPNQYDAFKPKQCKCAKKKLVPKKVIKDRKFRKRVANSGPGPADYMDPRTAFWYLKKPSCVQELSAFLTNAPRFRKSKVRSSPAPNVYKLKSFVDEMKAKVSPYAVRENVAFDTSVPKKLFYLPRDYLAISEENPCEQFLKKPKPVVPPPHPTYPFASKTKRFGPSARTDEVSPASYNVTEPFKIITNPRSFRKAKNYNFLVGQKRFGKITNFKLEDDKSYIPFVKYNLESDSIRRMCGRSFKRTTFSKEERSKEKVEPTPGPSDYVIPRCPLVNSQNVKLNPPSLTPYQLYKMKSRLKPFDQDTRKKWKPVPEERPRSVATIDIVTNFLKFLLLEEDVEDDDLVCVLKDKDETESPAEVIKDEYAYLRKRKSESDTSFLFRLQTKFR